jgi:hypothetical protein
MTGRPTLAACGAALCLGVVVAIAWAANDTLERDRALAASGGEPRVLAGILMHDHRLAGPGCAEAAVGADQELALLMLAISTVERHARGAAARTLEELIVRAAAQLGLEPPDLSIGDGQIRASTVVRSLERHGELQGGGRSASRADRSRIAVRLLDPCDNHLLGVEILRWLASRQGIGVVAPLPRDAVLALAASYNGQGPARDPADLLSKAMYRETVFHLYHELRFERLQEPSPHGLPRIGAHPQTRAPS